MRIIVKLSTAVYLTMLFFALNIALITIDVQSIGPCNSTIGLATINQFFKELIGESKVLYDISELLGIIPLLTAVCFGVLGVVQLIKGASFKKVDVDLIFLALFYVVVILVYVFYEKIFVNYIPVLIEGELEAAFPSSHTLLAITIMGTAIMQINQRIKNKPLKVVLIALSIVVLIFSVVARCLSGVHWFTDVLGGLLIGSALALFYSAIVEYIKTKM